MAEQQTATVSDEADGTAAPASRADAIAAIDDTIVRRLVRVAVHVRGYAPYYAATLALFAFLAFGPRPDSSGSDDAAFGAASTPATGTGGAPSSGGRSGGGGGATLSPSAAGTLIAGAAGLDGFVGAGGGGSADGFSVAGDLTSTTPALPGAPTAPEVDGFDPGDVDYGAELPEACTVALPSPAPSVSPSREVEGAQTTIEAATGVEVPADPAPYAEDVASAAGCPSVDDAPVPLPALPGLPV